jgi:hypothetical protein
MTLYKRDKNQLLYLLLFKNDRENKILNFLKKIGFYYRNFQQMKRYLEKGDVENDVFFGVKTTLFEDPEYC